MAGEIRQVRPADGFPERRKVPRPTAFRNSSCVRQADGSRSNSSHLRMASASPRAANPTCPPPASPVRIPEASTQRFDFGQAHHASRIAPIRRPFKPPAPCVAATATSPAWPTTRDRSRSLLRGEPLQPALGTCRKTPSTTGFLRANTAGERLGYLRCSPPANSRCATFDQVGKLRVSRL